MVPYISKAEMERARWMTLVEAVNHVRLSLRCDQATALSQLRLAVADQEIPVRWAADPLPPGFFHIGSPPIFSEDQVPTEASFWLQTLIFLEGDGRVIDQPPFQYLEMEGEPPPFPPQLGRPRPLLLLRSRVCELWRMPSDTADRSLETDTLVPEQAYRSASKEQIRAVCREIYANSGKAPPNVNQAWDLIKGRLNVSRSRLFEVLNESEFANKRRKRGKHS